MSWKDVYNYVIFDNPVSKTATNMIWKASTGVPTAPITIISDPVPLWKLSQQTGPFIKIAGICGAAAVALGAYGAHKSYPKDRVKELKAIYETGNRFHFIHTLALMGVPLCKNPRLSGSLFIVGTILFSGPCYYHAFTGNDKIGRFAPIGGTVLILAWLSMVI